MLEDSRLKFLILFFFKETHCTMDMKPLSERDICTKLITPAIVKAGWNRQTNPYKLINDKIA